MKKFIFGMIIPILIYLTTIVIGFLVYKTTRLFYFSFSSVIIGAIAMLLQQLWISFYEDFLEE